MLLGDVGLRTVHCLHMFPQRAGVCVPLSAARDLTYIGFLEKIKMNKNELSNFTVRTDPSGSRGVEHSTSFE